MRFFFYGATLAIFPLAMFFFTPVLGDISDHIGRKKVLIFSLVGTFIGYLLMAFSIDLHNVALFLLGRFIAGLTAGSQSIAQAAIIDISHPSHKAHNLSMIVSGTSVGWIAGPLVGGFLSDRSLVSWFGPDISFYMAAFLAFLNVIILQFSYFETLKEKKVLEKLHLHRGPLEFFFAFSKINLRSLSIIYLLMQFSWSIFFSYSSLFLSLDHGFTSLSISIFLALIAVGFTIPSLGLLKKAMKYLTIENAAGSALGISGVTFLLTTISTSHEFVLWTICILAGFGVGSSISYLLTLFSNKMSLTEQGRAMGIISAISSASWALSSLIGGGLSHLAPVAPLVLGGILLLFCSGFTYFFGFKKK